MKKIISIYNRKGGVGKTTTAFALLCYLALLGYMVLALDFDSQANLSRRLLAGKRAKRTLTDIITSGMPIMPDDLMQASIDSSHHVDFVPASLGLTRMDTKLPPEGKDFFVIDLLSEIGSNYDYIILDTPPSAEIQSTAALIASTDVLIPSLPETMGLEGVRETMNIVERIQNNSRLNPSLNLLGILLTKFPVRKINTAQNAIKELTDEFSDKVISCPIREGNKVEQAIMHNQSIITYDPDYFVTKDYLRVFDELFKSEL